MCYHCTLKYRFSYRICWSYLTRSQEPSFLNHRVAWSRERSWAIQAEQCSCKAMQLHGAKSSIISPIYFHISTAAVYHSSSLRTNRHRLYQFCRSLSLNSASLGAWHTLRKPSNKSASCLLPTDRHSKTNRKQLVQQKSWVSRHSNPNQRRRWTMTDGRGFTYTQTSSQTCFSWLKSCRIYCILYARRF